MDRKRDDKRWEENINYDAMLAVGQKYFFG